MILLAEDSHLAINDRMKTQMTARELQSTKVPLKTRSKNREYPIVGFHLPAVIREGGATEAVLVVPVSDGACTRYKLKH